jgi:polysaccharide deacetylase family protein (PEP-CTERM system associated)
MSMIGGQPLLLSVDFEDWHQLVRRRVGAAGWEESGPALARQTEALLELLEELRVQATFFILGLAARTYPDLVRAIAAAGHEIGCHGDQHLPVHTQTPDSFAADLRAARETIEELTGQRPVGYRAPAFSITQDSPWAYDVLAEEGFAYDASEHDTPRMRDRPVSASRGPHPIEANGHTLWELPVAVWRARLRGPSATRAPEAVIRVPVGGASYWAPLPTTLILRGLREAGPMAGLYLHPYELDPQPLRARLPRGATVAQRTQIAVRAAQRNAARRRAPGVLRAIAGSHRLITYGEAYAQLSGGAATSP